MINNIDNYTIKVSWSDDDKTYIARCVELESLSADGPTPEAAEIELKLVISEAIKWIKEEFLVSTSSDDLFSDLFKKYSQAGLVLKGARIKENLTQVELAEKLGIKPSHLSKMEKGTKIIDKEMAKRLAQFLYVDYRIFL